MPMPTKTHDRMGRPVKHGMHDSPENAAWRHMKDRCCNPKSQRFDRYGERGIKVCERWINSFENFYSDVGPRPSSEHSLGRIDNDGDYEPGNVRWETDDQQNSNREDSRIVEYQGESITITELGRRRGVCSRTLYCRLESGWDEADIVNAPIAKRRWLKPNEVAIIKRMIYFRWKDARIAPMYGVCLATIHHIRSGRSHKNIEMASKEVYFEVYEAIEREMGRGETK